MTSLLDKHVDRMLGSKVGEEQHEEVSPQSGAVLHRGRLSEFHQAQVPALMDVTMPAFETPDGKQVPARTIYIVMLCARCGI